MRSWAYHCSAPTRCCSVPYSDPYVPAIREDWLWLDALPLTNGYLGSVDCVVVLTDHREFDYAHIAATAPLVVDTRNALRGQEGAHIVRL